MSHFRLKLICEFLVTTNGAFIVTEFPIRVSVALLVTVTFVTSILLHFQAYSQSFSIRRIFVGNSKMVFPYRPAVMPARRASLLSGNLQ